MSLFPRTLGAVMMLCAASGHAATIESTRLAQVAQQEEQTLKARIGVTVIDTADAKTVSYRGDERFAHNSTHKALLCGALLRQVDEGKLKLSDTTRFIAAQLVTYSPVTEKFVAPATMSWQQVCAAALGYSDNTAANLLIKQLGGTQAVNSFLQSIGDTVTHLDRLEPELNSAIPGDKRDTTTPQAISKTLQNLALGEVLKPASRAQLIQWMREDKVADALLRSVLPAGWSIADKTGAGGYGSRSIISIVWPAQRPPLIVSIYITQTPASMTQSNEAIARIGKAIFSASR